MLFQGTEFEDVKLPCNRENMTKLAEALESGDYEQGKNYLLTTKDDKRKYCCLGVACEISGLGDWIPVRPLHSKSNYVVSDVDYCDAELPHAVQEWLGIEHGMMILGIHSTGDVLTAAKLNDAQPGDYPMNPGEAYDFA